MKSTQAATITDVAKAAGVSLSTASAALNGKGGKYAVSPQKREMILEAARRLNYEPNPHARRLAQGEQRQMIGLFSPSLDLGVGTRKSHVIQSELNRAGFDVPLYTYGYGGTHEQFDHLGLMKTLCRQKPRAVVCNVNGLHTDAFDELRHYIARGGIVVTYDLACDLGCDQVVFDRFHNTFCGASHLLELGHRKIGYLAEGEAQMPSNSQRLRGFLAALESANAPVNAAWQLWSGNNFRHEEAGEELATRFLALEDKPSGVCIINDQVAAVFINQLLRAGVRVPDDVSVVSHDDLMAARTAIVPISAVSHPFRAVAEAVISLLLERLNGQFEGGARRVEVRGELTPRESCREITRDKLIRPTCRSTQVGAVRPAANFPPSREKSLV